MNTRNPTHTNAPPSSDGHQIKAFSQESERLLLGAALDPARKLLIASLIPRHPPEDFWLDQHGNIWRALQALSDMGMEHDATAVIDHLRRHNLFGGGVEYVMDLADDPIIQAMGDDSIRQASQRVQSLGNLRRLDKILGEGLRLCRLAGQDAGQILAQVEDDLLNLRRVTESGRAGPIHIQEGVGMVLERLQRQMDGETIGTGVTTGSEALDKLTGGLVDEDLIVIGARPSMGKTAKLLNLARDGARAGKPALVFSLEMKQVALTQRLLAREARINGMDLRTGMLRDEDWARLSDGAHTLSSLDIWIDDTPGLTLNDIRSRARTFVAAKGKCTIYVDYLQKVAPQEGDDDRTHASKVSGGLKGLARELKVPVVALSQLNRSLESRTNKRPIMSDLRESGAIEQDADVIMFLYRDEVYNPESKEPGICEIIVAKQRDGAIGTVKRTFHAATGTYDDIGF